MAKKIFLSIVLAAICILGFSTISFAKSENTTTNLGDEVTRSINKTEKSMDDLSDRTEINKAGRTIENGARDVGNAVDNGMDDIGRGVEDLTTDGEARTENRDDETRTENRAVAGRTGNYTTGQIGQTDSGNGRNGMTENAWIWIVMVVVALIIVASVWFYAAQRD